MKELIIGLIIAAVLMAVLLYLVLLASKQVSDSANSFLISDLDETDNEDESTDENA